MKQDNALLVKTQRDFRRAADVIADAWSTFPVVAAIAVIGSVARPLWKEVPRFAEYRRRRIRLWHECKDVDLAVWIDDQSLLGTLRRVMAVALRKEREQCPTFGVADHQVDTFLLRLGRTPISGVFAISTPARKLGLNVQLRHVGPRRSTASFPASASTMTSSPTWTWRRFTTEPHVADAQHSIFPGPPKKSDLGPCGTS